jgi:hypothetical protein
MSGFEKRRFFKIHLNALVLPRYAATLCRLQADDHPSQPIRVFTWGERFVGGSRYRGKQANWKNKDGERSEASLFCPSEFALLGAIFYFIVSFSF